MNKPFLLLAFGLMLSACSVKEDREACPCLLSVIPAKAFEEPMEDDPDTEWRLTLTGYAEEGMIVEESFGMERVRDTLEYPVKKGNVVVTAWLAGAQAQVSGSCCRIPVGEEALPLYACREALDAGGETVCCTLHPRKQYSTLLLLDECSTEIPFEGRTLKVRGHSCGLDMATMQPIEGDFECTAQLAQHLSGRGFQVRIPRQGDASLELELEPAAPGDEALRFPLGEALFAQEYTPAHEEMPDYIVWLSAGSAIIRVSSIITIRPWK
ncbi:MAG: hypothetical protein IJS91_04235 [Bacteroidales bacterium]|nr:hypothetical protein [Bacteroidales bacterium]